MNPQNGLEAAGVCRPGGGCIALVVGCLPTRSGVSGGRHARPRIQGRIVVYDLEDRHLSDLSTGTRLGASAEGLFREGCGPTRPIPITRDNVLAYLNQA